MGYGANLLIFLFVTTLILNFGLDLGTNTGFQQFIADLTQNEKGFFDSFLNSLLNQDILYGTAAFTLGGVAASLLTGGIIIHYLARGFLIGVLSSWFLNPIGLIKSLGLSGFTGYFISGFLMLMLGITVVSFIGGKDV